MLLPVFGPGQNRGFCLGIEWDTSNLPIFLMSEIIICSLKLL